MESRKLRVLRVALGVPQNDLALRAGISPAHLCRIERGRATAGDISKRRLAEALGVPVDILFPGEPGDE